MFDMDEALSVLVWQSLGTSDYITKHKIRLHSSLRLQVFGIFKMWNDTTPVLVLHHLTINSHLRNVAAFWLTIQEIAALSKLSLSSLADLMSPASKSFNS